MFSFSFLSHVCDHHYHWSIISSYFESSHHRTSPNLGKKLVCWLFCVWVDWSHLWLSSSASDCFEYFKHGSHGIIPPQLGNLSFLVYLNMSMNSLHGELPHEFVHLRRLKVLDLGVNNLKGELPLWIGSFSQLRYFSRTNNSFTGLIPSSISNMSNLATSRLSYNPLQGNIPPGIFNISSLKRIALLRNGLSGSLSSDMCFHLPRLSFLLLSHNKLSGPLPSII